MFVKLMILFLTLIGSVVMGLYMASCFMNGNKLEKVSSAIMFAGTLILNVVCIGVVV